MMYRWEERHQRLTIVMFCLANETFAEMDVGEMIPEVGENEGEFTALRCGHFEGVSGLFPGADLCLGSWGACGGGRRDVEALVLRLCNGRDRK